LYSIIDAGYKNILIIDDGSIDSTHKILTNFQEKFPQVVVLKHFKNRGGGAALET
jgi:glycosyltransferase involved in cell wall biosynthesis